jgi:ATP-dependent protease HslVU (ClpYQ) ATPase subunit
MVAPNISRQYQGHLQVEKILAEFLEKNFSMLIEIELRRLHRRFDHFSAHRLHQILERVIMTSNLRLKYLTK